MTKTTDRRERRAPLLLLVVTLGGAVACDDGVFFPADYQETYQEVRNCRPNGGSHDFNQIRVVVDPTAFAAYVDRQEPFPVDAVVVKEEYDPSDVDCSGEVVKWSAMRRTEAGTEDQLGWSWQAVDADRTVTSVDAPRCYGCHAACQPPDGYEHTCTVP